MENKKVVIIDETLREGMQYRGLMFSRQQRIKILEFQETLKVDICQAGYPPAHDREADTVRALFEHAQKNRCHIRVAAMGRANIHDAAILVATGANDLHFHLHIKNKTPQDPLDKILADLLKTVAFVRKQRPGAVISIAMLDIGRSEDLMLKHCVSFLRHHPIDMVSLPDTSGMMYPNQVFEKIGLLACGTDATPISIHCHNDMGMASANSVMGILAGGRVLEASALGIGERNGIADLYTTAKALQDQGFEIRLNTGDIPTFKAYYDYVDAIVREQTGDPLLNFNTPVFGKAVKTHVAGTHAGGEYGMASEEHFFLNVLCGKHLVEKYLNACALKCPEGLLDTLTLNIKSESARQNRCLTKGDVETLLCSLHN